MKTLNNAQMEEVNGGFLPILAMAVPKAVSIGVVAAELVIIAVIAS